MYEYNEVAELVIELMKNRNIPPETACKLADQTIQLLLKRGDMKIAEEKSARGTKKEAKTE